MKHKKIVIGVAVVAIAIAGFIGWLSQGNTHQNYQVINGKVTGISNECHEDGICSVTLDDTKTIITGCGLLSDGKTCKTYDQSKLSHGQQIEATVVKDTSGTYSLECDSCAIHALPR